MGEIGNRFAEAARRAGVPGLGLIAVPGMQYSIRAAQRAEMAKVAAAAWCHQLGLDPQKVANMTLAEFAEMCVKETFMPEPPDIPRKVLAGLRYLGKKVE